MKIEAHSCNTCGKIAIAVDGRRLTDHRHPESPGGPWTVVESIHFYTDQGPASNVSNAILAGMLGTFLAEGVLAVSVEARAPAKSKTARVRANHLRVVPTPVPKTPRKR